MAFHRSPEVEGQLGKDEPPPKRDRGGGRGTLRRCTRFVSHTLHTLRYSGLLVPSHGISSPTAMWGPPFSRENEDISVPSLGGKCGPQWWRSPLPGGRLGLPGRLKQEDCEASSCAAAVSAPDAVTDSHPLPPAPLSQTLFALCWHFGWSVMFFLRGASSFLPARE